MQISWTRPAVADLDQLAAYREGAAPQQWPRILDRVMEAVFQLETHPQRGQREPLLAEVNPAPAIATCWPETTK